MDERSHTMSDSNTILKTRAKTLARKSEARESLREGAEFLEFALAQERYAIEACHIREVYPLKRLTPVPCIPDFVLGIINLRGQICSVIDIKKLIGIPDTPLTDSSKVIVVFNDDMELGILADEILGVRKFLLSSIKDDLSFDRAKGEYLSGVTLDRVGILDIAKLLAEESIVIYQEVDF
jgi:purine-binding chemotaxis protein CheW